MVVRVGVNEPFCRDTACVCAGRDAPRGYEWMVDVARGAGLDVRLSYVLIEDEFAPALAAGDLDGVIAKSWTALTAFRAAGVACERLCDLPLPDGTADLTGVFITTADSPLRSMTDLDGRRLGTGGPDSYENFHAVDRLLGSLGVRPAARRQYDRCVHAAVSVIDGETDAAVISSYCVRFGLDTYVGRPGVFRTLGETRPIPYATVAVSTAVPTPVRAALAASLLDAAARGIPRDLFPGGLRPPAAWAPEELERA
jgi:ABC-type phosphate/phosphonate transport system substrate-binding protein